MTTDQTADLTAAIYNSLVDFQRTTQLSSLQHAQMRQHLAEHLAGALALRMGIEPTPETVRAATLREAADAVFALDYDEIRAGHHFDSERQAWELGTIDAANLLRHLAEAASRPSRERAADVVAAATCSALYRVGVEQRECIRAAHHSGVAHTDEHGFHWSDTVAVYPVADGTLRTSPGMDVLRRMAAETTQPDTQPEQLVHVGWWCWRGDNHGHLATQPCRSDNVPIHVPTEWADDMRAVIQHIEDGDDEPSAPVQQPATEEARP